MTSDRRNVIPHLYCKGTYYDVGFDMGRCFRSMAQEVVQTLSDLTDRYLPLYNTTEGRQVYDETLQAVKSAFPQYIRELEGIADGAQIEFHKLFLLHLDEITPIVVERMKSGTCSPKEPIGCSTVSVNLENCKLVAHNEDAYKEYLSNYFLVSAHIISDEPQGKHAVTEERFTSLCYAANLPGYTMSYNHHGVVFTINTLGATNLQSGKIPRTFICRALLAAETYEDAIKVLQDADVGCADGCSLNMAFVSPSLEPKFYNIEMAPSDFGKVGSILSVQAIEFGETYFHCNKYLRIPMTDNPVRLASSVNRMEALRSHGEPKTLQNVLGMLGDTSNELYPVFRYGTQKDVSFTICVGVFDLIGKKLLLYSDNPSCNEPVAEIPFILKE